MLVGGGRRRWWLEAERVFVGRRAADTERELKELRPRLDKIFQNLDGWKGWPETWQPWKCCTRSGVERHRFLHATAFFQSVRSVSAAARWTPWVETPKIA